MDEPAAARVGRRRADGRFLTAAARSLACSAVSLRQDSRADGVFFSNGGRLAVDGDDCVGGTNMSELLFGVAGW